jgi:DNA polymerase-3 subunit alpha
MRFCDSIQKAILPQVHALQVRYPRAFDGDRERRKPLRRVSFDIRRGQLLLELQDHGIEEEKRAFGEMIPLGRSWIPFIVANDAHYLDREDALSHEVLLCIQTQTTMDDPNGTVFSRIRYISNPRRDGRAVSDIPKALSNTLIIAEQCMSSSGQSAAPCSGCPKGSAP